DASAGPEIEHDLTLHEPGDCGRVAAAERGIGRRLRHLAQLLLAVALGAEAAPAPLPAATGSPCGRYHRQLGVVPAHRLLNRSRLVDHPGSLRLRPPPSPARRATPSLAARSRPGWAGT